MSKRVSPVPKKRPNVPPSIDPEASDGASFKMQRVRRPLWNALIVVLVVGGSCIGIYAVTFFTDLLGYWWMCRGVDTPYCSRSYGFWPVSLIYLIVIVVAVVLLRRFLKKRGSSP